MWWGGCLLGLAVAGAGCHRKEAPPSRGAVPLAATPTQDAMIRGVISSHMDQVHVCYKVAQSHHPALAGTAVLTFVVEGGRALKPAIEHSTLGDPGVEDCLTKAVAKWRFPKMGGSAPVLASYPFEFAIADNSH
jgi:hypothetical protein